MKKLLLFTVFATASVPAFAYYGSYDTEWPGWMVFLSIIFFVWGILNIILFFKLWRATNDINMIKNKYCVVADDLTTEVLKLKLAGKDKEAFELLNSELIRIVIKDYTEIGNKYYYDTEDSVSEKFKEMFDERIKEFNPLYKAINKTIPEEITQLTYSQIMQFGRIKE